jgi:predicted nucleotidyltransferase
LTAKAGSGILRARDAFSGGGMKTYEEVREIINGHRKELEEKYKAKTVAIFGSYARNEQTEDSDVDFLVELEPGRTLLDLGGIQFDLEELLGRPVGVATPKSLKSRIRERGLREAVPLEEI